MAQTILVTGASGFIGRQVVAHVGRAFPGAAVVTVGRRPATERLPRATEHIAADLTDPALTARLPGRVTALVHLAADRRPHLPPAEFPGQWAVNVEATATLATWAAAAKAERVVYASSVYAYSGVASLPFREDDIALPREHLGATKLASEALLKARASAGDFAATALRIFTVYGPHSAPEQFLVDVMRKLAMPGPEATFGRPDVERDFVFVDDVAEAFTRALAPRDAPQPYEVFNIGSGIGTAVGDVVRLVARLMDRPKVLRFDTPVSAAPHHRADVSRAAAALGWRARTGLEDGLLRTVEAYIEEARSR